MTPDLPGIFAERFAAFPAAHLCDPATLETDIVALPFAEARSFMTVEGDFDDSNTLIMRAGDVGQASRTIIRQIGVKQRIGKTTIVLLDRDQHIEILLGSHAASVFVGRVGACFALKLVLWRASTICIGDRTTVNGARIVTDLADVIIGRDCMLSDEILVQANDQHGIVDLDSMQFINSGRRRTEIGQHVWVGRRAVIMPDTTIGDGSVVGAGSLVLGRVPPATIVAGTPARAVRERVSWTRSAEWLDPVTRAFFAQELVPKLTDASSPTGTT